MNSFDTRESLLKRIKDRRRSIKSFLSSLEPAGTRLTNFNIICGAIATVLTATPAIGGKTMMSTIAANLYKSHEIATRLGKAQACDAKLEGLETLLELEQITLKDSATQYTQYISEIPFVSDDSGNLLRRRSPLDWVKGEILEPKPNQVVENAIPCFAWVEGLGVGCHL